MGKPQHYQLLADLFRYPDQDFIKKVKGVRDYLTRDYPDAAKEAGQFCDGLAQRDVDQWQVLFTRSFDVQAITTLDVAYVLFGEDYKRGEILSNLNREHQKAKNDCGLELADHLPNLLCLISKLEDKELLQDLVQIILAPALQKMLREFDPESLEQKNALYKKHYKTLIDAAGHDRLVYQHALKALYLVLHKDFNFNEKQVNQYANNDFLRSVDTEMDIEKVAKE